MSLAEATAANLAGWHATCTRSVGVRSSETEWSWATREPAPVIFFAAITLGPAPAVELAGPRGEALLDLIAGRTESLAVCDSWNALDLSAGGLHHEESQVWMARRASTGPPPARLPSTDLQIVTVVDESELVEFEAAHNEGFGSKPMPPRTYYGASILDDPRMTVLVARDTAGRAVGTAMAYASDEVVAIYSVSVVPSCRGRGVGWSLTSAAMASVPDRTAVLQPSEEGASMYRRMGFEPFTSFAVWVRSDGE